MWTVRCVSCCCRRGIHPGLWDSHHVSKAIQADELDFPLLPFQDVAGTMWGTATRIILGSCLGDRWTELMWSSSLRWGCICTQRGTRDAGWQPDIPHNLVQPFGLSEGIYKYFWENRPFFMPRRFPVVLLSTSCVLKLPQSLHFRNCCRIFWFVFESAEKGLILRVKDLAKSTH